MHIPFSRTILFSLLLAAFTAHAVEGTFAAPEEKPAMVVELPSPLTSEELNYIHTLYRNEKINEAVGKVYTVETSKDGNVVMSIKLDLKSPVTMLLCTKLYKSEDEYEAARIEAIYKKSDAEFHARHWDVRAEGVWITSVLQKKCADDPAFFAALVAATKAKL